MLYYISELYKKFVTRNNALSTKPVKIFNHTVDEIEVSIVDQQNQLKQIPSGAFYFTGSFVKKAKATPIFLTTDYTVSGTTLTFKYSTYTYEFLNLVIGENVPIQVEIGYKDADGEHVILQDTAYANQRYYVEGMPDPTHVAEYYTKTETDAAIAAAISGIELSGYVTTEELEEGLATKQNTIDEDNKLPYSLISDAPEIPLSTSQLTNDSGFITETALEGLATETYVNEAISGKADETALTGHTSDTVIHVTAEDKVAWSGKQDEITSENKLDYALISGAPTALTGISLNGTPSVVTDNIVNIPRTSQSDWGVVKVNPGVGIGADSGQIYTIRAESAEIAARTQNFKPIVPSNLNEAVKAALTDANHMTLTDAEKETAMTVLGVDAAVSGYATETFVENAVSGKQDAITVDNKLDYALLSGTPEVPTIEWGGISGTLSAQTDLQDALNAKANATDIPLSTSQLTNDSGFVDGPELNEAVSGKQDLITEDDWLPGSYVRMDLDPWQGDPEFTVENAVNMVHEEALEALSGVDAVSGALSGKQDAITVDNKLDYALLSGTPSIPLSTSELINDSDFQTSTDVANAISGKAEQTDVAAISGELEETNAVLTAYIDENELLNTPFYLEAVEAGDEVGFTNGGTNPAPTISLQYSLDNKTWNSYTVGTQITLQNVGDKVYFKGNNTALGSGVQAYNKITCTSGTNAGGNAMSLLDETMMQRELNATYALFGLFNLNANIIDASKLQLPATKLSERCYRQMFQGCTSLTKAPKLPATKLDKYCYYQMLSGCSSLTTAPELPALTAKESCYYGMFYECTSLTTAPELPATELNVSCYYNMFYGCSALTTPPSVLPALVVPEGAYQRMFRSCTSLSAAPAILATTLADGGSGIGMPMGNMFHTCTSLSAAPELFITTLDIAQCFMNLFRNCSNISEVKVHFTDWGTSSLNATQSWLNTVAAEGTFYCPSGLDTTTRDASHIPENWTVVNI